MSNIYKFSVDNVQWMEEVNNELFRKLRIRAFATGENSHTLPVDEEVLKRGAQTIYDKPVLWRYSKYFDDALGHEPDEVPCGFIKECKENPIRFEKDMDKLFIVIDALIWTKYCGKLIEIFERDDMRKDVSIEIAVVEDESLDLEKPKIEDFVVAGITILGEHINPACKGCRAELLEFSEDKEKYLHSLEFEDAIAIDNSKESAVNGAWSNPRRKLFNPISKASNSKALLKEAYLIGDFSTDEPEITKFKYPHHVIRDGKLVIHQRGLEAAFQRASQQGIVSGAVKSHLLRHYRELGLTTENFSVFNISKEEFDLYFACDFSNNAINESAGESVMEEMVKNQEETVVEESEVKEACNKEEMEKPQEEVQEAETVPAEEETVIKHEDDEDEDHDGEDSVEDLKKEISELKSKIESLEADNAAYMEKVNSMCDYNELKAFKENTEAEKAREAEMAQMQKVMSDIEKRGVTMSDEEKNELLSKVKEFSSVDAWANFAKAQVFDRVENIDGIVRIGLPFANPKPKSSIWD